MKRCRGCGAEKPGSEFYAHKGGAGGLNPRCKDCVKAAADRYRRTPEGLQKHREASRREYLKNKPRNLARVDAWYRDHPEIHAAHRALQRAVKSGQMDRGACEVCGEPEAQGHHEDYSKPLEVRWLCRRHHAEHHSIERAERKAGCK